MIMTISKAALPLLSSLLTEKVTVETMWSGFNLVWSGQVRRGVHWEFFCSSSECLQLPSNNVRRQVRPLPHDCSFKGLKEQPPVIYREDWVMFGVYEPCTERWRSCTDSEINVPQMKNKSEGLDHMLRLYVFNCNGRGGLLGSLEW